MTLVLDASAAFPACVSPDGFRRFAREELVAPPLLWSEVRSALREAAWRGEISRTAALAALEVLEADRIRPRLDRRLGRTAWRVADDLGWIKTYDAEYVALALLLNCRLVTLDTRLRRAAGRIVEVVSPAEL